MPSPSRLALSMPAEREGSCRRQRRQEGQQQGHEQERQQAPWGSSKQQQLAPAPRKQRSNPGLRPRQRKARHKRSAGQRWTPERRREDESLGTMEGFGYRRATIDASLQSCV
jgi:hypothetical protein